MPVAVNFYFGPETLTVDSALRWLARDGIDLDIAWGQGFFLREFLLLETHTYGFMRQDRFLKDFAAFIEKYRGGPRRLSAGGSSRSAPSDQGVMMADSNSDLGRHARERLTCQLEVSLLVLLLWAKGTIKSGASLEEGRTVLQHGQGGPGQSAAHKIMLNPMIDGLLLHEIVEDSAIRTFAIYLQSQTSILKTACNDADDAIETEIRPALLELLRGFVNQSIGSSPLSFAAFRQRAQEIWGQLHERYLAACGRAIDEVHRRALEEAKNYGERLKRRESNPAFPPVQIINAKAKSGAALRTLMILDVYQEIATTMGNFPLSPGELENRFELIL